MDYYQRVAKHARLVNPRKRFNEYKSGAKVRGIMFSIDFDYYSSFWQKPCHYCGSQIETVGLDRINSDLGYVVGNIVSCCFVCNRSKMQLSPKEYVDHCARVVARAASEIARKQDS